MIARVQDKQCCLKNEQPIHGENNQKDNALKENKSKNTAQNNWKNKEYRIQSN